MAMRIFTESEFFEELRKRSLLPTNDKTTRSQIWLDENSNSITVPYGLASYPDYILDEILLQVGKLSSNSSPIGEKCFDVHENSKVVGINSSIKG